MRTTTKEDEKTREPVFERRTGEEEEKRTKSKGTRCSEQRKMCPSGSSGSHEK